MNGNPRSDEWSLILSGFLMVLVCRRLRTMIRSASLSVRHCASGSHPLHRSHLHLPSASSLPHPVRFKSKTTILVSKALRKKRIRQAAGLAAFHDYYEQHYGERWQASLFPALQQPTRSGALINRYIGVANQSRIESLFTRLGAEPWPADGITLAKQCWQFPVSSSEDALPTKPVARPATPDVDAISPSRFPAPHTVHTMADRLACVSPDDRYPAPLPYYPLDLASVLAVDAMGLQGHERVLDLCAAPGGKSITIAQKLRLEEERKTADATGPALDANDVSADRHKRLVFTLRSYLPRAIVSDYSRVNIANKDALAARMPQSQSVKHTEEQNTSCELVSASLILFLCCSVVVQLRRRSCGRSLQHRSPHAALVSDRAGELGGGPIPPRSGATDRAAPAGPAHGARGRRGAVRDLLSVSPGERRRDSIRARAGRQVDRQGPNRSGRHSNRLCSGEDRRTQCRGGDDGECQERGAHAVR